VGAVQDATKVLERVHLCRVLHAKKEQRKG
jgi:hypothetical protein